MADTTEIRTRDLRARTPTRLPLRFLTPPTGVQADQAEKKTSPRNDGPTEIRTRDPRVRSPTLYRYATPPTPDHILTLNGFQNNSGGPEKPTLVKPQP